MQIWACPFLDVKNERALEMELGSIWIGNTKLQVNRPGIKDVRKGDTTKNRVDGRIRKRNNCKRIVKSGNVDKETTILILRSCNEQGYKEQNC